MNKICLYSKALEEIEQISEYLETFKSIEDIKEIDILKQIVSTEENYIEFKTNFIQCIVVYVKNKMILIDTFILYDKKNNIIADKITKQNIKYFLAKNKKLEFDKMIKT